ncbi:MAG: prepilin-type N-terminal cleavage/methylation domain-containing protein [Chloroflexi bacterium]|nr:prepilin-type N-terminal cleavage/methylation domain-containing protein [Chloroflexota bacterium]
MLRKQRGFTLIELLLVLAISGTLAGAFVPSVFQYFRLTKLTNIRVDAAGEIEKSVAKLSLDTEMAATAAVNAGTLTMTWTDWDDWSAGTGYARWDDFRSHTVSYALVDTNLRRTYDGNASTVARYLSAVTFSVSGRVVTVSMTVSPEGTNWPAMRRDYKFYLRPVNEEARK